MRKIKLYSLLLITIIISTIIVFRMISPNPAYLSYYRDLKLLPIEKLLGWRIIKRKGAEVFKVIYLLPSDTCIRSSAKGYDSLTEIIFHCNFINIKTLKSFKTSPINSKNLSLLSDKLGVSEYQAYSIVFEIVQLYKKSKAVSIISDSSPSNSIFFSFGNEEDLVLTYISDTISEKVKSGILLNDIKIDKNWYFYNRNSN